MIDSKRRTNSWARQAATSRGNRPGRRPKLRILTYLIILVAGLIIGSFLRFADTVAKLTPPENPKADAIVVLTGGYLRIEQAVTLLETGAGKRLLISGVHPKTSADEIRKLTRAPEALFSCCVDLGREALDTIGNALETAAWVHKHDYKNVLVVTNNYHIPRSLTELSNADPQTNYIAYPVVNTDLKRGNWMDNPVVLRSMLSEYLKLTLAQIRSGLGFSGHSSLRNETVSAGTNP
ncbi:YdcF family protein [Rhizobium sp. L1K21]|uniref:YdcF family protein n=1 Tax=Rhizobium sp. L1K21 TaxID=2954933 RepID=UPI002093930A|nr:YdcF family protein [Rhizobium sp. L1K21]MCO6188167.1 YdcF family protein [Rhizobium sp. L1K21]